MSKLSVEIKPCKKWRRRLSVEQGSTNVAVMLRAPDRLPCVPNELHTRTLRT